MPERLRYDFAHVPEQWTTRRYGERTRPLRDLSSGPQDGRDWRPDDPGPIEVGIVETTPALAEWLWHWAEGGHIG